jgi:membrane protease YdiL (CAAX protease family)
MSDSGATSIEASPTETRRDQPAEARRMRRFEVSLVLLIAFGGAILNSLYVLRNGPGAVPQISNARWSLGIVQEVTALLLLGYVLSRRNLRIKDLGLRWSLRDVAEGLLLVGVSYAMYAIGYRFVYYFQYAIFGYVTKGASATNVFAQHSIVALPFSLLNPFFEELIVRAYLMTEVMELTGSAALAVALSVLVQFSYHLYYGWAGAITLSFQFLAFALFYALTRRALPVIIAHGFFDVYALSHLWFS